MKKLIILIIFVLMVLGFQAINLYMNAKRIERDIFANVGLALQTHNIDSTDLKIKVDGRDVVLTGEIESAGEKSRASEVAESVKGVRKLTNLLKIKTQNFARMNEGQKVQVEKIKIVKTEQVGNEKFQMKNFRVFFENNAVIPDQASQETLDKVSAILKDNPAISIEIHGHTNETGSVPFNLSLSQKRAEGIQYLLASRGVDASISRLFGHGERIPVYVDSNNEEKNRRVDLYIKVRK